MRSPEANKETKRQRQKEATKQRILNESRRLFRSHGFEVTVREIAQAARVAAGTLFTHFEDKRELLIAVLHEDLENVARESLDSLDPTQTPLTSLIRAARPFFHYYFQDPKLSRVLLRESLLLQDERTQTTQPILQQQIQRYLAALGKFLSTRQSKKPQANRSLLHFLRNFFSIYFFTLIYHLEQGEPQTEAALADLRDSLEPLMESYGFS